MRDKLPDLAATARAFATYSLVPYLGILFCPGAVVVGTVGVFRSYSSPHMSAARKVCYISTAVGVVRSYSSPQMSAARKVCYISTAVGVIVLIAQLLLWWILYQVPAWSLAQ